MERVPRQRSEAINTLLDLFDKYDITGPTAQMLLLLGELADLIIVPDPEDSPEIKPLIVPGYNDHDTDGSDLTVDGQIPYGTDLNAPDWDTRDQEAHEVNPLIELAEKSLRHLGVTDRASAERMLSMWAHAPELTERERGAILARFGGAR